jgi:hypothetical protein
MYKTPGDEATTYLPGCGDEFYTLYQDIGGSASSSISMIQLSSLDFMLTNTNRPLVRIKHTDADQQVKVEWFKQASIGSNHCRCRRFVRPYYRCAHFLYRLSPKESIK